MAIDVRTSQLRTFVAVADERHFGRAARTLGLAQSAVSAQLRRLEDELGVALLERTSRRVALTPAGAAFLPVARRVGGDLERAAADAQAVAAGRAGDVEVAATAGARTALAPAAIAELAGLAPDVEVRLRPATSAEALAALRTRAVDVALVRDAVPEDGLVVEQVASEPVRAVLPAGHRLAGRSSVRLADLAGERFVSWPRAGAPAFHDRITAACVAAGVPRDVRFEVGGVETRLGLVAEGLGVALEPATHGLLGRAGVRFVALEGDPILATTDAVVAAVGVRPAATTFLRALRATSC